MYCASAAYKSLEDIGWEKERDSAIAAIHRFGRINSRMKPTWASDNNFMGILLYPN